MAPAELPALVIMPPRVSVLINKPQRIIHLVSSLRSRFSYAFISFVPTLLVKVSILLRTLAVKPEFAIDDFSRNSLTCLAAAKAASYKPR